MSFVGLLVLLLGVAVNPVTAARSLPPPDAPKQGISGSVSIANISPLCFTYVNGTITIEPTQVSLLLTVQFSSGHMIIVPVNWFIYGGCALEGVFVERLMPGTYSVDLVNPTNPSWCHPKAVPLGSVVVFPRCTPLPITVVVRPAEFSKISISVTTGIY